jgi:hypothetical protein
VLSSIARQLLFEDVSLTFGTNELYAGLDSFEEDQVEIDNREARHSAEILCHLITNPDRAAQVTLLTVAAPNDGEHILFSCFMGALPPGSLFLLNGHLR